MIDDLELGRLTERLLADGPVEYAPTSLDRVMAAVAVTQQRRRWGWPSDVLDALGDRFPARSAFVVVASAIVVVLMMAGTGTRSEPIVRPATETVPPVGLLGPLPPELATLWFTREELPGLPRGLWALDLRRLPRLTADSSDFGLLGLGDDHPEFNLWLVEVTATASRIRFAAPSGGVCGGVTGDYQWSIDPAGGLRFASVDDACAERSTALLGRTWRQTPVGALRPGRVVFDRLDRPFALTVPAGLELESRPVGWQPLLAALSGASADQRLWIGVAYRAYADPCGVDDRQVTPRPDRKTWATLIQRTPGLAVARSQGRIGGLAADVLDIEIAPTGGCPTETRLIGFTIGPDAPFDGPAVVDSIGPGRRERMYLVDRDGWLVAIMIQAPEGSFDAWLADLGPVIDSLEFIGTPPA